MIKFIVIILIAITSKILTLEAQENNIIAISQTKILKSFALKSTDIKLKGKICKNCQAIIDVSGPKITLKAWEKIQKGIFWIKDKNFLVKNAKSFYFLTSTERMKNITYPITLKMLKINNLGDIKAKNLSKKQENEFLRFYRKDLWQKNLLIIQEGKIKFNSLKNFTMSIVIPSNAVNGIYEVRFFVFKDFDLVDKKQLKFEIESMEFYLKFKKFILEKPKLYILLSISIALIFGYLAAFLFRKDK